MTVPNIKDINIERAYNILYIRLCNSKVIIYNAREEKLRKVTAEEAKQVVAYFKEKKTDPRGLLDIASYEKEDVNYNVFLYADFKEFFLDCFYLGKHYDTRDKQHSDEYNLLNGMLNIIDVEKHKNYLSGLIKKYRGFDYFKLRDSNIIVCYHICTS